MAKHERESRPDERHKRRRDDDKKKKKKKRTHKKHKDKESRSHRRHKRSRHSSESESDTAPVPDYTRAMTVVRELLTETPELAKDLLRLLQMLDDGEVAVIGGIENRRIRSKLKELFPLLGLVKLREPKGAFTKPRGAADKGGESLMEVFQRLLSGALSKPAATAAGEEQEQTLLTEGGGPVEEKSAVQTPVKRDLPIGPALPLVSAMALVSDIQDDDDDDEVVGPALPGMKGFRLADERVEAEMAREAKQLEKEQWERARNGGRDKKSDVAGKTPMVREAWMTMMPESSILKDSLGPQNRPPPGKPAAFRSKEPAAVDKTWFDSPEERERAKRAKLDMELLGYVREENAPSAAAVSSMASTTTQPSVNESILPNANPEADVEMRKQMEKLRESRGPTLLEQHQRKQAEQAKSGAGPNESGSGWNRDRDLTLRRGMSGDDAERMISAAKQINSKFTAPTISRQFL
ncbi:hypothetical protein PHYPSEUDO_014609 [Phytophthora pseudosyringae]|uniref:DUF3752 domain-containing protein n=1 Tax=Phytophthora pseudosyringae TaxID=221518 RepID=A0A8T1W0U1_9STRA|nr:hypothetical protein PHYPSEUDO_014609 [Phytophthora pseudosyringae]